MPTFPKDQCSEFGCKLPCAKGKSLCETHAPKKKVDDNRKQFNKMYSKIGWDSIRKLVLSKTPLCNSCQCNGHVNMASHVDHLFAWSAIGEHAFMRNIFQPLCPECHGIKSALEKKGIFRHYVQPQPIDYELGDYQRVIQDYENGTKTNY
jgi:5-methylcytosine-specific restriction endonuclease McrA